MAKPDYGFWLGNFVAVVLVTLVLATFYTAFQSIREFDTEEFKQSHWAAQ